ncbi:nuclear transport factor 2 domain protein [Teladorsagia circumcincta]|uniref:NTF2-related export protein n=1 Tax=Teladorsagia circumcincta TaxID=45464 RepID=A0A2G9UC13_TELCI|nr:nuclear transport factor 2 domain protein [Teladorsagia circumcincta]
MNFNPDYETIATAFVQHYYSKFDQGDGMARAQGLGDLYDTENSYMSFEGVQCKGRDAILAKFSSLTFKQIQRAITKCDSQPLYDGSILVMVLGQLKVFFGLILPWITAPSGEGNEEMDDKKLRKRERREKIVYRR